LVRAIEREHKRLGKRLRVLRQAKGWSQEVAAERVGVHPKTLGRVERGTETISLATLVAVARAYDVELVDFFAPPSP
jgi:transcriptional regulator with XRE-family HTH domain